MEPTYRLRHIRFHTVPNFDVGGGCDPYFDVRLGDGKQMMFDWKKVCWARGDRPPPLCLAVLLSSAQALKGKVKNYQPKHKIVDLSVWEFNVRVKGDVKIVFYGSLHLHAGRGGLVTASSRACRSR